jgi:hypothetical protein
VWRFGRGDGTNQSKIDDSIPAVGWLGRGSDGDDGEGGGGHLSLSVAGFIDGMDGWMDAGIFDLFRVLVSSHFFFADKNTVFLLGRRRRRSTSVGDI